MADTPINRHGLRRYIPSDISREVRKRCGFGCVNCGNGVYKYEHLDPEFVDAKSHDPNSIILLCGTCTELRTKRMLSVETLRRKQANPVCLARGFSRGPFDVQGWPTIVVGALTATKVDVIVQVMGETVLAVLPPEEVGGPCRITALFRDFNGEKTLEIIDNEWRTGAENWDATFVGNRITVRSAKGMIALVIRSEPPHRFVVERLDMEFLGNRIVAKEGAAFEVELPDGRRQVLENATLENQETAIVVTANGMTFGGKSNGEGVSATSFSGLKVYGRHWEVGDPGTILLLDGKPVRIEASGPQGRASGKGTVFNIFQEEKPILVTTQHVLDSATGAFIWFRGKKAVDVPDRATPLRGTIRQVQNFWIRHPHADLAAIPLWVLLEERGVVLLNSAPSSDMIADREMAKHLSWFEEYLVSRVGQEVDMWMQNTGQT